MYKMQQRIGFGYQNVLANIEHIDILINNAGIANDNYFYDKTREEFLHILTSISSELFLG